MELEQFKTAWRERPPEEGPAGPTEDIMSTLLARVHTFNRDVVRRDWRETAAALFVAVFFGFAAIHASSSLERAGARLIVLGALLIPVVMHWTRRQRGTPAPELSLREFVEHEVQRLDDQIELLRTVAWWYVAPPFIGAVLYVAGRQQSPVTSAIQLSVLAVVAGYIYWANRATVRRELQPLRDELTGHLEDLRDRSTP